jgi:hypothetical protein
LLLQQGKGLENKTVRRSEMTGVGVSQRPVITPKRVENTTILKSIQDFTLCA